MAPHARNGFFHDDQQHHAKLHSFLMDPDDALHDFPPPPMATDTMREAVIVPTHPIASMQEAFAESMREASENPPPTEPKTQPGNAAARRQALLDQDLAEETSRWVQKPGQKYHELWKLMAQISFGIYLLLNGIAKDDNQVMNILQGHVDEIDEFLELTLEDFDLAQEDIDQRLKFLKLPLENIAIFDAMLEDRQFRLQIVSGNERIEHVITRTAMAMKSALKDVKQGISACREFTIYLAEEQEDPVWRDEYPDMEKVYQAMKGNVDGWYKAYVLLQTKGNHLGVALVQLGSIVAEMDRRAGEISRKTRFSNAPQEMLASSPVSPPQPRQSRRMSMLKSLPSDPNMITPAIRAALPTFQLVQDRERTPEPKPLPTPDPELYILAPRTYTPVPSPKPEEPVKAPTPPLEIKQRSSMRQRFSLKRKEVPQETLKAPAPRYIQERQNLSPVHSNFESPRSASSRDGLNSSAEHATVVTNPNTRTPLSTPPSRGLDSAYCSDFEKPSPGIHAAHRVPSPLPSPGPQQQKQYFRPVNASPHSPLQRPWTAAHGHSGSYGSERSAEGSKLRTQLSNQTTPSQHNLHERAVADGQLHKLSKSRQIEYNERLDSRNGLSSRGESRGGMSTTPSRSGMQSRMGMSMMSDMTTVTNENGQKVRKKRSAFGWLKKAFALSDEEKATFEQRRRMVAIEERPTERWLDGKRIDPMSSRESGNRQRVQGDRREQPSRAR